MDQIRTKIVIYLIIGCSLSPNFLCGQGEFNNWYFGHWAGLRFTAGVPNSISNGVMGSSTICTSVSDSAGNFLFFSDGFSCVYNANKTIMPNSYNLHGITSSFFQPVIAVKEIGSENLYYLFTVGQYQSSSVSYGLEYSIINMNLNGGLGDIEPGQKNISLPGMSKAWGAVNATRHLNNRDVWVVTRLSDTDSNYFSSILITSSGINSIPVLSNSQVNPAPIPNPDLPLEIKISPDGTRLVCAHWGTSTPVEFCQFDPETGHISSLIRFNPSAYNSFLSSTRSMEFSIDSKFLYVSTISQGLPGYGIIYQYDVSKTDSLSFMQSEVLIGLDYRRSALQMGPNWKIYCSDFMIDSLHVINIPSFHGIGCNFQINAVSLNGQLSVDGLPQFVQKYKAYIHHAGDCPLDPVNFTSDIWPPPDSIRWNFGDPASGVANTSTLANPSHNFTSSGNYTVALYVRHNDNRTDTTWQTITIQPAPQPVLGPDQTICAPQTATFDAGACAGCTYQWDDLATMTMNIGSGQTYTTGTPGLYRVNVTGPNGCTGRDTVLLTIGTPVAVSVVIATVSTTVCAGEQVTFTSNASNAGSPPGFQWNVNGINASNANNATFIYTPVNGDCVTLKVTSNAACVTGNPATSNPVCMTVNQLHPVSLNITSTSIHTCASTPVTFNAFPTNPGNGPVYQWKVNGTNSGTNSQVFTYTPVNGDCITCELTSDISCPTGNPALSNTICMIVDQLLPVSIIASTPQTTVCAGTSVTFTANPTHGGLLPGYQWKVNAINVPGSTNSSFTYVPLNGDIITCELTSSDNCVTGNPALSPPVTMTVTPNPAMTVSITPSANPFCPGSQVTFLAVPNHGGLFPVYLWKVNGGIAGTNSSSFTYTPLNGDVVTCELTSSDNCVTGNPATSAPVTMIASSVLAVAVSIAASSNPFCAGSQVTFTATPDHGGLVPGYQWKVNGSNAGTNSPSFTFSPANGDQVSCILNSSASCITGNPALSNIITMTVKTNLPAGVSISTPTNPFCPGTAVTFTANPTNGGGSPSYQWKLNGVNAGTNSTTFTCNPAVGDSIRCMITSNLNCVTGNPASSGKIIMSGNPVPGVSFTACFDSVTILSAQPFSLHGGLPQGGQYNGPGVNAGIFTPSVAGTGLKTITYGYANVYTCLATKTKTILVQPNPSFNCGNNLTDIRDNKVYPTIQIGSQCWMASNLDFGAVISDLLPQTDNCIAEKYHQNSSFYQWDELVRYSPSAGAQGLCPPGWHIPTTAEWNTLLMVYNGPGMAGGPMKDTLLPNGFNSYQQGFLYLENTWAFTTGLDAGAMYWTSTASGVDRAVARGLNNYNPSVSMYPSLRGNAFSVRCCRD